MYNWYFRPELLNYGVSKLQKCPIESIETGPGMVLCNFARWWRKLSFRYTGRGDFVVEGILLFFNEVKTCKH